LVDVNAHALLDAVIGQAQRRAEAADIDRGVARILGKELQAGQKLGEPVDDCRRRCRRLLGGSPPKRRPDLLYIFVDTAGADRDMLGKLRDLHGTLRGVGLRHHQIFGFCVGQGRSAGRRCGLLQILGLCGPNRPDRCCRQKAGAE
jgi:hypothetical protein